MQLTSRPASTEKQIEETKLKKLALKYGQNPKEKIQNRKSWITPFLPNNKKNQKPTQLNTKQISKGQGLSSTVTKQRMKITISC